jgi:molybdopterin-guanine dinucleotide biosynthesis protein A
MKTILVVAVLAGGLSSRMGQDKRFLKLGQQSLLDRTMGLAESLDPERVLICGNVPGRDCLPDKISERGPISGLLSAVHAIQKPAWLLVLPVDMPLLTADFLKDFLRKAEKPGVAYQDYELPLLFWCDAHAVSILENLERWSIKAFLEAVGARRLELDPAQESRFANLNYPQDWEKLREYSI